ncbi:MAG: hypothetical protein IJL17_10400 [Kiritimatiellae bacterium]|nr:hypothetical protein [Kiritimatiellia bacterium]
MTTIFTQPLAVLMFCLALGFLIGRVKLRLLNSTLATLFVAILVNMQLRCADLPVKIPSLLSSLGFVFFSFTVGFSAAPCFVESIHNDGMKSIIRQVLLALTYFIFAAVAVIATVRIFAIDAVGPLRGLLAGSLTQVTILEFVPKGDTLAPVAYGISYPLCVFVMILFVQTIAPWFMRTSPIAAVRQALANGLNMSSVSGFRLPARLVQMRAYRLTPSASLAGATIREVESLAPRRFEVVAVHPGGGNALPNISQETRLGVGDVMVVIGDARIVQDVPIQGIEETSDSRYLSVEFVLADIVLAEGGSGVLAELTAMGILLREAIRNGRVLSECHFSDLKAGDVLKVVGLSRPVKAFAESRGYLKNDGSPSDFFMITFALALAVVIGSISLPIIRTPLGAGCCSLLIGLVLGWFNQRRPDIAHVPCSALSFLRLFGLNVFVCIVALNAEMTPSLVFTPKTLVIMLQALLCLSIPLVGAFVVGRYVLRLPPVSLLGGICGCGTSTPALNALEEETESSVFTAAYTIPYVVGNILLTILGVFAEMFI